MRTEALNDGVLLHRDAPTSRNDRDLIKLPEPAADGGMPLLQTLKLRHTVREFSNISLPLGVISELLWAAFGVNRRQTGGRTAPSAHEWHEIEIYIATGEGLYLYDAHGHALRQILARDIRIDTGLQPFVADAPVNLVYVADYSRMADAQEVDRVIYSATDTGFISQNVYLYCTSAGLATVVRGLVPRQELAKLMKLRPSQRVILAQSVGYPAIHRSLTDKPASRANGGHP